jgi:hypothetical protein
MRGLAVLQHPGGPVGGSGPRVGQVRAVPDGLARLANGAPIGQAGIDIGATQGQDFRDPGGVQRCTDQMAA